MEKIETFGNFLDTAGFWEYTERKDEEDFAVIVLFDF